MRYQRLSADSGPSQELPPGTQLEEFIIERVLGSGGFGITYLARDKRLGRQVVIKENLPAQFCWRDTTSLTVQPRQSSGEDADNFQYSLESFEKEAATLASLDHPGIVKVLRSFEANGTAYFVMPFVEGTTFDEVIKERHAQGDTFTEEELSGLLWRVLEALGYLHERGINHRDIKPGNILITVGGDPVLIDFGAARREVRFDYHKLTGVRPEHRMVQPYHVGQIEHGWYLVAYDPSRKDMRTFALQRLTNLEVMKSKFERDKRFSARTHLGGGFGVWSYDENENHAHEIRIRFEGYAARVVGERMWHASQEIVPLKPDGSVIEFRARLSGLEEITRWVLSWGSKAQVLGPQALKKRVKDELRAMVNAAEKV